MSKATQTAIRVLVVDDHTLFRRGLIALLSTQPQLQVVGEAADASAAERLAAELPPQTASRIADLEYAWGDAAWMQQRAARQGVRAQRLPDTVVVGELVAIARRAQIGEQHLGRLHADVGAK